MTISSNPLSLDKCQRAWRTAAAHARKTCRSATARTPSLISRRIFWNLTSPRPSPSAAAGDPRIILTATARMGGWSSPKNGRRGIKHSNRSSRSSRSNRLNRLNGAKRLNEAKQLNSKQQINKEGHHGRNEKSHQRSRRQSESQSSQSLAYRSGLLLGDQL